MADDQVKVSIVAQANGVAPGVNQAKDALNGLSDTASKVSRDMGQSTAQMNTAMIAVGGSFRGVASDAEKLVPALSGAHSGMSGIIRESLVMTRELANGNFTRMAGSASILTSRLYTLSPAIVTTGLAVAGLAAPFVAFAAAVQSGINETAKFNGSLQATNGYAGITISQLQNMARELSTSSNVSIGTATEALMKLAASGKVSGQSLLLIGQDAIRMGQLTGEGADKFIELFAKMGDDVAKFAEEYQGHYHQLTSAQIEHIRKLQEEGNADQARFELAKTVYEYLGKQAPQNLGYLEKAWHGVGEAISSAWDYLKGFGRDSAQDKIDGINRSLAALRSSSANARFGMDNSAAIANLEAQRRAIEGTEAAQRKAAATGAESAKTQTEGASAADRLHKEFEATRSTGEKLKTKIQEINQELAKAVAANPANKALYEKEAAALRAQAQLADAPKVKKTKEPHDDTVQKMQAELDAKKAGWDAEQVAQNSAQAYSVETEAKFWAEKLKLAGLSADARTAIMAKSIESEQRVIQQQINAFKAGMEAEIDEAKKNGEQQVTIAQQWAQRAAMKYGLMSQEYRDALAAMTDASKAAAKQRDEIADIEAKGAIKAAQDGLKAQEAAAKFRVTLGVETNAQLIAQERKFLDTAFAEEMQDVAKRKALAAGDPVATAKIEQEKASIIRKYQSEITANEQQAVLERTKIERQAVDSISQSWAQNIGKLVTLQQGLNKTIQSGYMAMVNAASTAIATVVAQQAKKVALHLLGIGQEKAADTSANATQGAAVVALQAKQLAGIAAVAGAQKVADAAMVAGATASYTAMAAVAIPILSGLAGAGGVASMAAAPFPMDTTAPEFGATMKAAALTVASAEGGMGTVPYDNAPFLLHKNEMVLPANLASPLRSMLQTRGMNDNSAPGQTMGGGDTHVHIHATDADSVKKLFASEQGIAGMKHALQKASAGLKF
jgi:hypothetical protein